MPPIASGGAATAAAATAAAERQQPGGDALAVGLAERDQPHAGRDDIGGEACRKSVAVGKSGSAMRRAAWPTATG